MPFDDFDNKIKQAAEQHHPNYDEKAWSKMNVLLNKHLPQKEDGRRRIIFFLLAFLLLGGGATWLLIDKPWRQDALTNSETIQSQAVTGADPSPKPGDSSTHEKEETSTISSATDSADHSATGPSADASAGTTAIPSRTVEGPGDNVPVAPYVGGDDKGVKNQHFKGKKAKDAGNQFQVDVLQANIGNGKETPGTTTQGDKEKQATQTPEKSNEHTVINSDSETKPMVDDSKTSQPGPPPASDLTAKDKVKSSTADSSINSPSKPNEEKKTVKKERIKKPNLLSFSLSAGPDVSSVGMGNPGKVRLLTGAGLAYTLRDRLTIRTGFYSANKVYVAKPNDYKPSVPPNNLNYLTNISANCKVYEIPLSLAYNFGKSEKHKTFASAGLSSFIMKKETYDYLYEYPSFPNPITYHYIHTENNKYKHYFSVLSISAGYQRKINRILSVTAEPYFKLPLAGVGYGKIKLNSFGMMFSVNVSPFAPKK
jgi:hypothetical protein